MPAPIAVLSSKNNYIQKSDHFIQSRLTFLPELNIYLPLHQNQDNYTIMNEETIFENRPVVNGQQENNKKGSAWKQVTLGGVSGILMGAGLMYAGKSYANAPAELEEPSTDDISAEENKTPQVATVSKDLSFGDAFTAARAAVGPGGVFEWHGGLYNTYTADEWNAMTVEQKNDFAEQVHPITPVGHIQVPTDTHTHVVIVHDMQPTSEGLIESGVHETANVHDDVQIVEQRIARNFDMGDDVHIVGYASAEGHLVVGYDTDNDGMADVAIIDIDGTGSPSDPDIIMDDEGHMATLGDIVDSQPEPDYNLIEFNDNPEVATDMPDYMNDADLGILA